MTAEKRLKQVSGNFVQGQIDLITGNSENVLMEHDVKRISDSINTDLIQPVIDYVTECDNILLDTIQLAQADIDQNTLEIGLAKQEAQAATQAAQAASTEASGAKAEAGRAHVRLDKLEGAPSLDTQTWNWMPRLFDTASITTSTVMLADQTRKPTIMWRPMRQNTESNRYILEGTISAYVKVILPTWTASTGQSATGETAIKRWNGWINFSGVGNAAMKLSSATINATTTSESGNTAQEHVRYAAINVGRSTSQQVYVTIVTNDNDLDTHANPVYISLEVKFLRDSGNDFGFGNLYPELNPTP